MDELVLRKYSGNDKIKTIQTLRELFALDLSEAKEIVDDLSSGTEKIMQTVRRHIVGGANRTLFSVDLPPRLCRTGT